MAKRILQKVSFGLLRTNPKLTTNVKLVVDSTDKMFLESFDEVEELSDVRFKGFKVSGGSYSQDLYRFYDKGKFPKEIAYQPVIKDDSQSIKKDYSEQYDMTYASGAYAKISKLYEEEFALLAPLWIEPLNIPDYFVIFKNPDPVSINSVSTTEESNNLGLVGATHMYENTVSTSKIHAIIDLTENSNIGRYIRRHALDELFPESPLKINFKKNEFTEWKGISIDKGEFTSKSAFFYEDLLVRDKSIMEFENLITNGFQSNGIVCANVLNLEFLFDDIEAENYEINRYYGLYCNAEDICKFKLDPDALFEDKVPESTQIPIPKLRDIGTQDNLESQVQTNSKGIKIYADVQSGVLPKAEYFNDSDYPRFGFVKDKNGKLYSVKNGGIWDDNIEIRVDDNTIDWKDFTGFNDALDVFPATFPKEIGRPSTTLSVVNNPDSGDQLRIRFNYDTVPDYSANIDQIETHTITATTLLPAGTNNNRSYSSVGTLEQVALAIRKAINSIFDVENNEEEIFRAVEIGTEVVIYSRMTNSLWNKITIYSYKGFTQDTILIGTTYSSTVGATYINAPSSSLVLNATGVLAKSQFTGGQNELRSRVIISIEDEEAFTTDRYLKTQDGYSRIKGVWSYLEEPVYDKIGNNIIGFDNIDLYKVVEIVDDGERISLNSSSKVTIYETVENGAGFISFYPIKDFDFDFHNTDYTRDADADTQDLVDYLGVRYADIGTTGYIGGTGSTAYQVLDTLIGPTSIWQTQEGFVGLVGIVDETTGELAVNELNEYDRLKENENGLLALESRVLPFINKWVFDDFGKDVRENEYRLNVSESFRYSNFSPSFKHFTPDPKFYTNEWYYLQQYPPYMTNEEKTNAFSYFDTELDLADLYNVVEDKFVDYFAQDNFGINDFPTKFKYSIFSDGDNVNYSTSFFRGVKVKVTERDDETQIIDFNINDIRTKASDKFNNYKFSAVLVHDTLNNLRYRVIKNDTFKHITMVVGIDLLDDLYMPGITGATGNRFFDRTMLYNMDNKYDIDKLNDIGPGFSPDDNVYSDIEIAGSFELYPHPVNPIGNPAAAVAPSPFTGLYIVKAVVRDDGSIPNLSRDMVPGENGRYQNVTVELTSPEVLPVFAGIVTFDNIIHVYPDSIICEKIYFRPTGGLLPTTDPSYQIDGLSWSNFPYTALMKQFIPKYLGGGFGTHAKGLREITFAAIADKVNTGNPEIEYWNVDSTGATSVANDFILELLEPEQEHKVSSFGIEEDLDRPTNFSTSSDSIGTRMKFLKRTYVAPITRYNGNYAPRVYDVVHYINDVNNFKLDLIAQYNAQGATADVDTIIDNVTFGINQSGFGKIKNMYRNKVNENNPRAVLEIDKSSGFNPIYPRIDEIAIDYKDFDIFKSNWDIGYFIENIDKSTEELRLGTRSMIEKRSYFGSKIMNLPNTIELESFDVIDIQNDLIGGRELYLPSTENFDSVYKIFNAGKNVTITGNIGRTKAQSQSKPLTNPSKVDFWIYIEKALEKFLIADGIGTVFNDFINPAYSFGLKNSVDDDIKKYIASNILKIYEIDTIELYELRYWKNPNNFGLIEFGLDDTDRRTWKFQETKNFQTQNLTNSNLNFKLIYNIPIERKSSSISLKVRLRKK